MSARQLGRPSRKFLDWNPCQTLNAYFNGDETTGKATLKDFINSTIALEKLATVVRIPSKSRHRMLSPSGNPSPANFFAVLRALQKAAGLQLKVRAV
jgi:DNA-binding phage protein